MGNGPSAPSHSLTATVSPKQQSMPQVHIHPKAAALADKHNPDLNFQGGMEGNYYSAKHPPRAQSLIRSHHNPSSSLVGDAIQPYRAAVAKSGLVSD